MTALLDLTTHPGMMFASLHVIYINMAATSEKLTRAAAINTVRRWAVDAPPMDSLIREFALNMLRRLQAGAKGTSIPPDTVMKDGVEQDPAAGDVPTVDNDGKTRLDGNPKNGPGQLENRTEPRVDLEDAELIGDDIVQTPYSPERIELPAQKQEILQHVELLFALCVKVPDFLDE
jgi:symplekin